MQRDNDLEMIFIWLNKLFTSVETFLQIFKGFFSCFLIPSISRCVYFKKVIEKSPVELSDFIRQFRGVFFFIVPCDRLHLWLRTFGEYKHFNTYETA